MRKGFYYQLFAMIIQCSFFEHKGLYRKIKQEVPAGEFTVPLGKAHIVRPGNDASVIAYGSAVHMALEAA